MPTDSATKKQENPDEQALTLYHRLLFVLCVVCAVGALGGGIAALLSPDGTFLSAQDLIPVLHALPLVGQYIDSLTIPAIALLVLIFLPQTVAILFLLKHFRGRYLIGIVCGVILVVFTAVEIAFMPNVLSWIFLFAGVFEAGAAVMCRQILRDLAFTQASAAKAGVAPAKATTARTATSRADTVKASTKKNATTAET
ncbi:MAG: hypothetical protein FWD43_05840, partial [Coriobacteriia bacterium]|nr:hypothetical protein [Coriobacteriia bacterium]